MLASEIVEFRTELNELDWFVSLALQGLHTCLAPDYWNKGLRLPHYTHR